ERGRAPERSQAVAEIDDVVANVAASVSGSDEACQGVLFARIEVVDPGSEQPHPPELPPVLMRDHVVRIVAARALILPGAERGALQDQAAVGAEAPVGKLQGFVEGAVDFGARERPRSATVVFIGGVGSDAEPAAV